MIALPFVFLQAHTQAEEVTMQVSLWAGMDVECNKTDEKNRYNCQVNSYKPTFHFGFSSTKNVEITSGDWVEASMNTFFSGGLLLPVFLFSDGWKTATIEDKSPKIIKREIEKIEQPENLSVKVFIDGQQTHSVKTNTAGKFMLEVKSDSVYRFYAVYDKRSLVLQQDIYFN